MMLRIMKLKIPRFDTPEGREIIFKFIYWTSLFMLILGYIILFYLLYKEGVFEF